MVASGISTRTRLLGSRVKRTSPAIVNTLRTESVTVPSNTSTKPGEVNAKSIESLSLTSI